MSNPNPTDSQPTPRPASLPSPETTVYLMFERLAERGRRIRQERAALGRVPDLGEAKPKSEPSEGRNE
jgi:hypothetical protein